MSETLMTVHEVAAYLNVSVRTVYRLPIRYTTIGARRRYEPADVRLYVSLGESRAPLRRAS